MALLLLCSSSAWVLPTESRSVRRTLHSPPPCRMEYGERCYEGAIDPLPENVFEVLVQRPLGIGFEEDGPIIGMSGVSVNQVVEDSHAARGTSVLRCVEGENTAVPGKVMVGDKLVGVTAIRFKGSKWEREMFDCRKWSFDTVVDAIGSNEEKFVSDFVLLQFERREDGEGSETA